MVKLTENEAGKSYLGKKRGVLPMKMNWIGKKLLVELTAKVAFIYRLSSSHLIGTFFERLKLNVYFPGYAYDKKGLVNI